MKITVELYDYNNDKHVDFLVHCLSDHKWGMIYSAPFDVSLPPIYQHLHYASTKKNSNNAVHLIVKQKDKYIAFVSSYWDMRFAQIVGGVSPEEINRGHGVFLYAALINLLWVQVPGLEKIYTKVSADNVGMRRLNEALGFKLEGEHRKEFYNRISSEWCDCCYYGVFRDEVYTPKFQRIINRVTYNLSDEVKTYFHEFSLKMSNGKGL